MTSSVGFHARPKLTAVRSRVVGDTVVATAAAPDRVTASLTLKRSLMNTEAGKIQGNLHTWGIAEVQDHKVPWGNYDVKDTDGQVYRFLGEGEKVRPTYESSAGEVYLKNGDKEKAQYFIDLQISEAEEWIDVVDWIPF